MSVGEYRHSASSEGCKPDDGTLVRGDVPLTSLRGPRPCIPFVSYDHAVSYWHPPLFFPTATRRSHIFRPHGHASGLAQPARRATAARRGVGATIPQAVQPG